MLKQNIYVKRVGPKGITYTDEMKRFAMEEANKGSLSLEIFEKAGFDVSILGIDRVYSAVKRWRTAYKKSGIIALQDTRKSNSGRPLQRELSLEEQLERKDAKIKFLEVQLEFQKKLDMIGRGVYIHKNKRGKK